MLKQFTIRQRILVTFLSTVLIGGIIQLFIAGRQLQVATIEFYQHHLETDALMIAASLSEPLEHYLDSERTTSIRNLLANIQKGDELDILMLDHNYRILGYTADRGYEAIDKLEETPELREAKRGQIGDDIRDGYDGSSYIYVAVPITYEQHVLGYLVLSRPMRVAYLEVYQQWLELSGATFPVIVLVIMTSLWLSTTISSPIQQLRNSALKMAEGAFDTRISIQANDEVGQLAHSFNYMAEQVEGLMNTQRSFVSNAAHELRTPLMTLKLRVEALADEDLPTSERTLYLQEINEEIDHMAELVSSLLILARIDEGRHKHGHSVMDASFTLRDIARHWRIEAAQSGLTFEVDIPDNLPDLTISPNDLRLILDNLIGNAIKYTPHGTVKLRVLHNNDQLLIRVTDTGIGFDPILQDKLFVRFYRTDETRTDFEGNGLGLSIVQGVLDQYSGKITASSQGHNQGATFTVYLPLRTFASK